MTGNRVRCRAQSLAGYFGGVSNIVQHALSDLFEDTPWLLEYVAENNRRLGAAYDAIAGVPSVLARLACREPMCCH